MLFEWKQTDEVHVDSTTNDSGQVLLLLLLQPPRSPVP